MPSGHQIRAISNDELADEPKVGAIIEIVQSGDLWTYVRTVATDLDNKLVKEGNSSTYVNEFGVVLSSDYSVVSVTPRRILLDTGLGAVALEGGEMRATFAGGGFTVDGAGIKLTAGEGDSGGGTDYQVVAKARGQRTQLTSSRETVGNHGQHSHSVNLADILSFSKALLSEGLVGAPEAPGQLGTPINLSIVDAFDSLRLFRTFSWTGIGGGQSYTVQYSHTNHLPGERPTPEWNTIAHGYRENSLTLRTTGVPGRKALDSPPPNEPSLASFEMVGFRVRGIGDDPLRHTAYSEPKFMFFANNA